MAAPERHSGPQENQRDLYNLFQVAGSAMMDAFRHFSRPPHELSLQDVRVLLCLAQSSGRTRTVSKLAEDLRWSPGWTSRMLDPLMKKGLVNCIRDTRDRRIVHVKLTAGGVRTAHLVVEDLCKPMIAALGDVPEQHHSIKAFLRRFCKEIDRIQSPSNLTAISTAKMSSTQSK